MLRIRGCKKIYHADADTSQKKMGMAILAWNKEDFRAKTITRDKEAHFIIIKGSVNEEDITILNVYTPNNSFKICEAKTDRTAGKKQTNSQL